MIRTVCFISLSKLLRLMLYIQASLTSGLQPCRAVVDFPGNLLLYRLQDWFKISRCSYVL